MKAFLVILSVVTVASCGPVSSENTVLRSVLGNFVNCNSDLSLCMKEHALKASERLSATRKLKIFEGITLLNNDPKEARSLDSLTSDPALRNKQVTERLWERAADLLQSTELELSYGGSDADEAESRSIDNNEVEESRGKKKKAIKKKLKILIPLILLAKAKAIAIAVIALVVIAASLFKIALLAKIAFIIKLIAIIKALIFAKKHSQEEISWEPHGWDSHAEHHPVAVEHGHGWEGGWSRSKKEANNLAYSAYNH